MGFGRPTKYTPELAALIIERFATHPCGLNKLCAMYDDMPNPDTIYTWRKQYPDFSELFLNARLDQAHILFDSSHDDIQEIQNYYFEDPKTGAMCVDSGIVAAQKAIAQHKMCMAAKIRPRDYGNRQIIENQNTEQAEQLKQEAEQLRQELEEKNKKDC